MWWQEALVVLGWGLVPAAVLAAVTYDVVQQVAYWNRLPIPCGLGIWSASKQPWALGLERHMLVSVEAAAALTTALAVFAAVAWLRCPRRRRLAWRRRVHARFLAGERDDPERYPMPALRLRRSQARR